MMKMSRRQLYDEIWELSVAGVAKKYNLDYVKLIAACKAEEIPFPNSGYWTKKNWGKDVSGDVIKLSGEENKEVLLISKDSKIKQDSKRNNTKEKSIGVLPKEKEPIQKAPDSDTDNNRKADTPKENEYIEWADTVLDFLNTSEREQVLAAAGSLMIRNDTRLHSALVKYKKDVSDYKAKLKEAQNKPYYNPRYNRPANEPDFFKEMSEAGMIRAFAILDALFKTIEKLGGTVNSDLSVKIRNDIVRFRMAEGQDQVKHELTKQEAKELVEYNDKIKHDRWASKPQIRKYDKVYNGKLRIVFGDKRYIRDSASEKLESRLGEVLIMFYENSEENRIAREKREEEERKRAEEAKIREEKRQRKEREIQLTKELVNEAEDYKTAVEIRAYIQAMIGKGAATSEWIEWAAKKADWYDPSVSLEDEYLGKREHGKSREEKDNSLRDSVRRGWYW